MPDQSRPWFSVVIPTYNYAHYLPRALDSVLAQSGDDYSIVIVDDGSTDETAQVVARWTDRVNKPVAYVSQPNRGLAAARNRGIDQAAGEFVLFLDADDELLPGAFRRFRSILTDQHDLDFVYGGRTLVSANGKVRTYPARRHLESNDLNFYRYLKDGFTDICAGCVVIHRRVFKTLRFAERIRVWEDIVFHAQLIGAFSGMSFPEPVVQIHRHADSLSHNPEFIRTDLPKVVEILFDSPVLPDELSQFRPFFLCRTRMALFDAFYRWEEYENAVRMYSEVIRLCPWSLLSLRGFRRYFKSLGRMVTRG